MGHAEIIGVNDQEFRIARVAESFRQGFGDGLRTRRDARGCEEKKCQTNEFVHRRAKTTRKY
jgi:hypothetical protein